MRSILLRFLYVSWTITTPMLSMNVRSLEHIITSNIIESPEKLQDKFDQIAEKLKQTWTAHQNFNEELRKYYDTRPHRSVGGSEILANWFYKSPEDELEPAQVELLSQLHQGYLSLESGELDQAESQASLAEASQKNIEGLLGGLIDFDSSIFRWHGHKSEYLDMKHKILEIVQPWQEISQESSWWDEQLRILAESRKDLEEKLAKNHEATLQRKIQSAIHWVFSPDKEAEVINTARSALAIEAETVRYVKMGAFPKAKGSLTLAHGLQTLVRKHIRELEKSGKSINLKEFADYDAAASKIDKQA
ncbi:hypothetical protein O181_028530 [Austropuccinia psidii MF-1]|uniref:Uncharacterized protein n=1 Tax=Austropuccinia psidii MF-1 TaxID=1389203 RepID=A0A9Q3H4A0_9BASI|nr:hypothetical protein [Austropuccinia psidii MF-1]